MQGILTGLIEILKNFLRKI